MIKSMDYFQLYNESISNLDNMHSILVVDDDNEILELLNEFLSMNGYIVYKIEKASMIKEILDKFKIDAIIMDVMLGKENGLEYLKKERKNIQIPIILLTALGDFDNRIYGLESGAEDYLNKPFDPRELLLRLKKILLNYKYIENSNKKIKDSEFFKFGEFKFDIKKEILYKLDQVIYLTTTETQLFLVFINNPGIIMSRESIIKQMKEIYSVNNSVDEKNAFNERTIDTQILRLRNKIEEHPKEPKHLKTIRNLGYVLRIS